MTQPTFIHLRLHSEFSISDGLVRIKPLMQACRDAKMPAVGLTDACNFFAAVKLFSAAYSAGIKPILGTDIVLHDEDLPEPTHLTLLCQNQQGYANVTKLISRAYQEGQNKAGPVIAKPWLQDLNEGIIVLSGGMQGDVAQALTTNNHELSSRLAEFWQRHFPDRYYLEISRVGKARENEYIHAAAELALEMQLPLVATNDVRFISQEDFIAHEARVCVQEGTLLNNPKRVQHYTDQQYLRTPEEMLALFEDLPESLENTVEIAKRCNLEISLGEVHLPAFPTPDNSTEKDYLERVVKAGLQKRLTHEGDEHPVDFTHCQDPYVARLNHELEVINSMGYIGYFLIVADFINWAKKNDVPVGPGRGSGAGSIVAYALGITDIDPLAYELLFERFLNPERVSMPDFDIDFCMEGRDRVIDYVTQKYGRESVSQIITFGTMAAKAVVRDVGRVLGHPYGFVDKIAKLIPFELGITLDKALADEELLRERYNNEEDVKGLIDLAKKLEGITRSAGKHAGGVVIAPSALTDFVPLYCEPDSESRVTQFDKDDVESIGLVKFDFLGLRTLTIIKWTLDKINKNREAVGEAPIDINHISKEDPKTYKLLQECQTSAVFQLESRGMKDLIKRLSPDCFEHIIALVALFRPGPLQSGMVDDFIERKQGRADVQYPHPDLEPILRPTFGVILYQEQVMQIAQVLAGYTLGGADVLRRAMGKKKVDAMAKQREIFTKGAVARGVEEATATGIFDLMEKFAGYGFNKSHSAAYALIAYQTAWLKAHYPAEFMAAVLSSDMDNTDKVVAMIAECKALELEVLPPDVNQSDFQFCVNAEGKIVYGLGALKGVGEAAIAGIIACRKTNGAYSTLFDFCQRADLRKVNKRVLEALILSGAMDGLGTHRAALMASLKLAVKLSEQQNKNETQGQFDMFAGMGTHFSQQDYLEVDQWRKDKVLEGEKTSLGLYFSGHPIARYWVELDHFITHRIADLNPSRSQTVVIAGLVVSVRTVMTKKGDRMAFVALDDSTGRIDIAIFPETYQNFRELLVKDNLVVVSGEVSVDDYSGGFRMSCKEIWSMLDSRIRFVRELVLSVAAENVNDNFMSELSEKLTPYKGGSCPVGIQYSQDDASAKIVLGKEWAVKPADELIDEMRDWLGEDTVALRYV